MLRSYLSLNGSLLNNLQALIERATRIDVHTLLRAPERSYPTSREVLIYAAPFDGWRLGSFHSKFAIYANMIPLQYPNATTRYKDRGVKQRCIN